MDNNYKYEESMNVISELDKKYNHVETQELLAQVREFFQSTLRIIVPEYVSNIKICSDSSNNVNSSFLFVNKNVPIYLECNGSGDLSRVLNLFDSRLIELADSLEDLCSNSSDLSPEYQENLDYYAQAIEKCMTVYGIQRRKREPGLRELETVQEIQDSLRSLFAEIISNYIVILLDALYERIKNDSGSVYITVVKYINNFLSENGISTKEIKIGEKIDPEFVEPSQSSSSNYTDDYAKFETIEEICRYPYQFNDGSKIVDGIAKIWRRKS